MPQSVPGSVPFVGFVGRRAELGVLVEHLGRLADGTGGAVVIEGENGIGTSRLIREALDRVGRGVRVLHVAGRNRRAPQLFAVGSGFGARDAAENVTVWVAEELGRGVPERPVVLVLEDMHRMDPATVGALQTTVSHLDGLPVLLIVTANPGQRPPGLDQLLADLLADGADHLRLTGLDPADTAALAAAVAATDRDTVLRVGLGRTGGIPRLVVELIRALDADGALGGAGERHVGLPVRLLPVVLGRLGGLPRATVDLLRAAAVLGPQFEVTHLARIADVPAYWLLSALADALRARVLDQVESRLAFRPELVWEALYDDIAPAIRSALHADAGRVLAEAGAPASVVADHLVNGAVPGDPELLRHLRAAAQEALGCSPRAAVELLQRALAKAAPCHRDTLLGDLVVAQLWSGDTAEAERAARDLLDRPHGQAVGDTVRLALVEAVRHQGRYAEAASEAASLLAQPELAEGVRPLVQAEQAHALLLGGDLAAASVAAAAAITEADGMRDGRAGAAARAALAAAALGRGRTALAVDLATAAVDRAQRNRMATPQDTQACALIRHTQASALVLADRPAAAERALDDGLRSVEALGNAVAAPSLKLLRAVLRFRTGRWDDAVTDAEAGLAAASAAGVKLGVAPALGVLAMIALHRNDFARADVLLARAEDLLGHGAMPGGHWVAWARGLRAESCGRIGPAADALRAAWRECTRMGTVVEYPLLGPDLVRLLLAVDDGASAGRAVGQVEEIAARTGTAAASGTALRCRALWQGDQQLFADAAQVLAGEPYPFVAAQVSEEAAVAGAGKCASGTAALLEVARTGFRALGARRELARVEARLRSIGVRSSQSRRRSRGDGWDSLTAAERDVVALVTEGLTNREIAARLYISPRTVETHLTRVFAKLDLGGRRALRLAAAIRDRFHAVSGAR